MPPHDGSRAAASVLPFRQGRGRGIPGRPVDGGHARQLASLGLLLPYLRPYWGRVALAGLALVAAAGLTLGLGQGLRHLVDEGFSAGSGAALDRTALVLFGLVAALATATAGGSSSCPGSGSGWRPTCGGGSSSIC
jgi:hypothetical protein